MRLKHHFCGSGSQQQRRGGSTRGLTMVAVCAAMVSVASPGAAFGQCQYEVTAIIEGPSGCPIGDPNGVVIPQDMNDHGEVVGYWRCPASTTNFAFRWSADAGFELLDIPIVNVTQSKALGINNYGDLCGWFVAYDADKDDYWGAAFVLKDDGEFISIPVPDGGTNIEAHAINDSGQVCGWWKHTDPVWTGTFIWENGRLETIIPVGEFILNNGFDINESGQVTGWVGNAKFVTKRAFIWTSGGVEVLQPIPGGLTSDGRSVNGLSEVTGNGSLDGAISHGYAATVDAAEDLGGVEDYVESWARDIHDNGLIVGYSTLEDAINPATLWHNGEAHNMNLLIDESFPYTLNLAIGINEAGAIIAKTGSLGVLLTPIDQPEADISGDCSVDVVDLLKLLENWSAEDSFADIDNNGVVGVSDLLMLLADWDG